MSNPFSVMNLMIGCCKERHLTRLDPNAKDENVSWISTAKGGNWSQWDSVDRKPEETLYVNRGWMTASSNTPFPYTGLCQARDSNGAFRPLSAAYMSGPAKTSTLTSELYFRAIVYNAQSGRREVACMLDPSGNITFTLEYTTYGDSDISEVTAKWTAPDGTTQTISTPLIYMSKKLWTDIKVYIPANGDAIVEASPVTEEEKKVVSRNTQNKGFRDQTGDKLHVFTIKGAQISTVNEHLYIHRIGVGNKLTTARP